MANRLSEAARTGNVGALQNLLGENPSVLVDFILTSPDVTPLHVATKAGQLVFVQEILRHKPEFARELNQEGFRPMDIASALGYVEIVTELMRTDPEICRLRGRDGRTALHYAAINGRVMVIRELLSTCGELIKDVTSLGETALHLAVKYCKFEAFECLINWLNHLHMEELVNKGDRDGNTILHISVSRKQLESVEFLLNSNSNIRSLLELNAINSRGLTAMDIMDIVTEGLSDIQLREVLQCAGALKACDINGNGIYQAPFLQQRATNNNQTNKELLPVEEPPEDWLGYFKFKWKRDSPSDTRNALLVVAALITTVTFQAGLSPPSYLQKRLEVNSKTTTSQDLAPLPSNNPYGIFLGIPSTWMMFSFMFVNTLALAASFSIIGYLTAGFPFQRELQVSVLSMMLAYDFAVANTEHISAEQYSLIMFAFLLPFLLRYLPRCAKKAWKSWAKPWSSRDQVVQGA